MSFAGRVVQVISADRVRNGVIEEMLVDEDYITLICHLTERPLFGFGPACSDCDRILRFTRHEVAPLFGRDGSISFADMVDHVTIRPAAVDDGAHLKAA
jgi:hypothetical protein